MMSLERRLQLGLGASLLVLLALLLWGGTLAVRAFAEDLVIDRLEHHSQAILGVHFHTMGRQRGPGMGPRRLPPVYNQPESGHYFLLQEPGRPPIRSASLGDFVLTVPLLAPGGRELDHVVGPQEQELLTLTQGLRLGERNLSLTIAEDVSDQEQSIRYYQWLFALSAVLVSALLLLVQTLVVRRSLASLDQVREDVRGYAQGQREGLSTKVPAEILPLVEEVNRLLQLLGTRLQHSRHSLGNLAHALKTPLNLLVQQLDQARADLAAPRFAAMERQLERLRQLIERELHRARLAAAGGPVVQRFHPGEEIPELIRVLQQMHLDNALEIEIGQLASAPLELDREDMLELLGNLLDNACTWARQRVQLEFAPREDQSVHIRLEDDGRGVSEAELLQLAQRGVRIDEQSEGHGLGLAIALDIAQRYGGRLEFSRSGALGGLRVDAWLYPFRTQSDSDAVEQA